MLYCVDHITVQPGTGTTVDGKVIAILNVKTTGQTSVYVIDVLVEMSSIA